MKSLPVLALAALLVTAGAAHAADAADAADSVRASRAWIRVLPGDLPAGGYVTLSNDGDRALALTGASSPAYGHVMLHRSRMSDGMSRMSMVERLPLPAHATVTLAPGGYHLMLMHAVHPVKPGDTVKVTLRFADGSTLQTDFAARPANASAPQD